MKYLKLFALIVVTAVFLVPLLSTESASLGSSEQQQTSSPSPSPTPPQKWRCTPLRITGISANPGAQRSPTDEVKGGEIWTYSLVKASSAQIARGNYQSPIFLANDESILAVKGDSLVRLPASGGAESKVSTPAGIVRLI